MKRKSKHLGRWPNYRFPLERRLKCPNWRPRPAPYMTGDFKRGAIYFTRPLRKVPVWIGGGLLTLWLRTRIVRES